MRERKMLRHLSPPPPGMRALTAQKKNAQISSPFPSFIQQRRPFSGINPPSPSLPLPLPPSLSPSLLPHPPKTQNCVAAAAALHEVLHVALSVHIYDRDPFRCLARPPGGGE
jgi:hypothetical protein